MKNTGSKICNQYFTYDYVSRKYFRHSFFSNNLFIKITTYFLLIDSTHSKTFDYHSDIKHLLLPITENKSKGIKCLLKV